MSKLASGMAEVNAELSTLVHNLTPATETAWKTAVAIYQVNAMSNLIYGLLGAVVFTLIALAFRSVYFVKRPIPEGMQRFETGGKWTWSQQANYEDLEVLIFAGALFFGMIALWALEFSTQLLCVWNWLALIHPHLYAAHEVMNSVMRNS
jgi:hypothetical protein